MGPQLCCRPSAAAVETGAGLNPNGVCGEGSQVMKGLLGGSAFRQLQGRGTDETVTCQRWDASCCEWDPRQALWEGREELRKGLTLGMTNPDGGCL